MPPRIATHVRSAGSSEAQDSGDEASEAVHAGGAAADNATGTPVSGAGYTKFGAPEMDALHFFGVFDGHGALPRASRAYYQACMATLVAAEMFTAVCPVRVTKVV